MIEHRDEFISLLKEKAYRKGEFTLSSGEKSEHYVNCKPVTLQSDALLFISWCMLECLEDDVVAVGGLTLGADPLVSGVAMAACSYDRDLSALIVRKQPKGHGTQAWIEGPMPPEGSLVTVLEDVVTSGASAITAAQKLRLFGYVVDRVVSIVDRQEGGEDAMIKAGLQLRSLFTLEDLL